MIAGIGTDIVEVERILQKISTNEYFKTHVFSMLEIEYCDLQTIPSINYSARWAVKEAFLKAFGVTFIGNHKLPEIETQNDENGKPTIVLHGQTKKLFEERGFKKIHVSISHTKVHATAYVIIEN
jgi:holo-[acyl-carrier protein] synthase